MLVRWPVNFRHALRNTLRGSFSTQNKWATPAPPPTQTYNEFVYTPKKPFKFEDGRCVLYRNRQGLLTNWYLYSHITLPMLYLAILIKRNPFFLTFPAALPLMFVAEGILLRRFFLKQVRYRPIVQEIRLLECGNMVEVKYANEFTRNLKNLPMEECFTVDTLNKIREADEDPITEAEFPRDIEKVGKPNIFEYAWIKQIKGRRHLMIPRRYEYADMEALIEIFNGKIVMVEDDPSPTTTEPTATEK